MIDRERLLNRFLRYVQIDSETGNELEMAELLSAELSALGLRVDRDDAGEKSNSNGYNVYGFLAGDSESEPILLSAHMDTVSPGAGVVPVVESGVVRSDGSTVLGGDDKSGIAIIMECIETIVEKNIERRPIEVVFTICEEGGLNGAKNLDVSKLSAKHGIAIDSGGPIGTIYNSGPSQDSFHVKIIGKTAHAGMEPEKGVSSIGIAAEAISSMPLYRVDEDTTANIGTISGGVATNIIASDVVITAEARSKYNEKLDRQSETMKRIFEDTASEMGGKAVVNVKREYGAFNVPESQPFVSELKDAFSRAGFEPVCKYVGGGGDANIYFEHGIDVVNISSGMTDVHTVKESIRIEDMYSCSKVLLDFLASIL